MTDRKEYQARRYRENINGTKDKNRAYYEAHKEEINRGATERARKRREESRKARTLKGLKIRLMHLEEIKNTAASVYNETMEEIRETEDRIAEMTE